MPQSQHYPGPAADARELQRAPGSHQESLRKKGWIPPLKTPAGLFGGGGLGWVGGSSPSTPPHPPSGAEFLERGRKFLV